MAPTRETATTDSASGAELDVDAVRKDFPILARTVHKDKPLVYLDNAATTHKPEAVIDAIDDFYRRSNSNVHRGLHELSMEASELYEKAHETVADFVGADGMEEIVFTSGTTDAINLVAYAFGLNELGPGDEVVGSVMEHHSNFVPWQQIAKARGATYKHIPLTDDGMLDMEAAKEMIGPKTRLVSLTSMSNVLGTITPVRELAELAHDRDALFLVDGAQSVPHTPTDVKADDVDLLAFSGHKMLGPTGVGVLYGKREVLSALPPFRYGGEMIKRVTFDDTTFNDLPWKFEAGTPVIAPGIGLAAAVDYLTGLGMENVRAHEKRITAHALKRLADIDDLTIYGPPRAEDRGGLVAFTLGDLHAHDLADLLDQEGFAVRAGHHCAQPLAELLGVPSTTRASFYVYNTIEEVDRLADTLERIAAAYTRAKTKRKEVPS